MKTQKKRLDRLARRRPAGGLTTFCYPALTDPIPRRRPVRRPFDHQAVISAIAAGAMTDEAVNQNATTTN